MKPINLQVTARRRQMKRKKIGPELHDLRPRNEKITVECRDEFANPDDQATYLANRVFDHNRKNYLHRATSIQFPIQMGVQLFSESPMCPNCGSKNVFKYPGIVEGKDDDTTHMCCDCTVDFYVEMVGMDPAAPEREQPPTKAVFASRRFE